MHQETNIEHKRQQARERKRKQREREKALKQAVGATEVRFEFYAGTLAALERLQAAGEFEDREELITVLIHNADALRERDPSRFAELVKLPSHATPG